VDVNVYQPKPKWPIFSAGVGESWREANPGQVNLAQRPGDNSASGRDPGVTRL